MTVDSRLVHHRGTATGVRTVRGAPGRPYVLVHGIGASSRYFVPLTRELRRHGDVHVLDLPGFGGTPRPPRTLPVAALAAAVHACLVRLDLPDPVLVGHSLGAQVVVSLLAAHPTRSSSAALIGPTVNPAEATAARQMLRLAQSAQHESRRVRTVVLTDYVRCGPRWFARELRAMLEHPMAAQLAAVGAPVLVVRGERDRVAPAAWAEEVAGRLPRGRLAVVPGGAHAVMHDRPRQVAGLLADHARRT